MQRINHRTAALLAATLGLATAAQSDAQRTARMKLPEGFADRTERLEADGFGGRNRGEYELGPYRGEFVRIESRWAVPDPLYAQNRGRSSYTLQGPGVDEPVAASCEMKRGAVTVGVITFDPQRLTYQCELTRGGAPLDGSFVLGEPKPENLRERALALSDRRGEARVGAVTVAMRSVHDYEGSRLKAPMPVGYLLEVNGRAVGALELTDVDPTIFLPTEEPREVRSAVLIAAMGLAVLRDPASSALDE
jgi:hypothetical protein